MKNRKGLGSIPRSLAWIDSVEESVIPAKAEPMPEVKEKNNKQKQPKTIEKHKAHDIALQQSLPSNVAKIEQPAPENSSMKGLPEGWTRATFIVNQEINEKLKALAYWERVTVKEIMHEALMAYLQDKNVRAMPKKKLII